MTKEPSVLKSLYIVHRVLAKIFYNRLRESILLWAFTYFRGQGNKRSYGENDENKTATSVPQNHILQTVVSFLMAQSAAKPAII